jgi:Family of unknown function (DUF6755)
VSAALRPPNRTLTAIDGAIALVAVLLIVQMWLLTATLEAFLAGHHEAAIPAAVLSGVLFAGSFGLYWFVDRADRASRRPR